MGRKKEKALQDYSMGDIKRALILPDLHVPYEDERAVNLAYQVGVDAKVDLVLQGGDLADLYSLSAHGGRKPDVTLLQKEVHLIDIFLRKLEATFPEAELVQTEGNHEYRLPRFLVNKAPELFGVKGTDLKSILEMDRWNIIPYGPEQLHPVLGTKLYARHEPYGNGLHAAHLTISKGLGSFLYFHTHRKDEAQRVSASGKVYRGFCPGWLGDKTSFAFDYVKTHYQWTQGFAIVYGCPDGNFFHQNIDIVDHKCIWNGKLYKA